MNRTSNLLERSQVIRTRRCYTSLRCSRLFNCLEFSGLLRVSFRSTRRFSPPLLSPSVSSTFCRRCLELPEPRLVNLANEVPVNSIEAPFLPRQNYISSSSASVVVVIVVVGFPPSVADTPRDDSSLMHDRKLRFVRRGEVLHWKSVEN